MEWVLLEILVALGLAGFIVWYTTSGSRKRGSQREPRAHVDSQRRGSAETTPPGEQHSPSLPPGPREP